MKKYRGIKIILFLAALLFYATGPVSLNAQIYPDPVDLNIPNIEQETNSWCWAAIAQQVINRHVYGSGPSQCDLVNAANGDRNLSNLNCCRDNTSPDCSRFGYVPETVNLIKSYGGMVESIAIPNDAQSVYGLLKDGKALIVGVKRDAAASHMYLVKGIFWDPNNNYEPTLMINDPETSQSTTALFSQVRPAWMEVLSAQ